MAISTRLIRRRIRSVANTRKITKAMELVSAAKMRRAVQMTIAGRPYAKTIEEMVAQVRELVGDRYHPLLHGHRDGDESVRTTKEPRTLLVVMASDRGLCGGFNGQLLKRAMEFLSQTHGEISIVTVGKRAEQSVRRSGHPIRAAFEAISNHPVYARARPIGDYVYATFMNREVERIFVAYTDFKSAISFAPRVMQLLPIGATNTVPATDEGTFGQESDILFEPAPDTVLDHLLPRLIETQMYQALLESSASEHSARMMSMRNATENASSMLEDLTFTFNQARQASITREISEISAGKAAIE